MEKRILLAHGNGGKLQQDLLHQVVFPAWQEVVMSSDRDSQVLSWAPEALAISTDSYVVNPLFFPGGNIGHLAICGTTNDLAMSGAQPLYLTVGFILEEGFPIEDFQKILTSMGETARSLGLKIAAGDIKVVEKGKGDGLFINTTGIGQLMTPVTPGPDRIRPGNKIIVSGDLARHGLVIMMSREGMEFSSDLVSDCAPLWPIVKALQEINVDLLCLRDLTRGGLATALHELAHSSGHSFVIEEGQLPLLDPTQGACEVLGIEPIYLACEGTMLIAVAPQQEKKVLELLHCLPGHQMAATIGEVVATHAEVGPEVRMRGQWGGERRVSSLLYESLPRIC
ncbi:MAG: hydrogenase expression/formation protein HypE [Bdellovibrionaceae bacterium]|nr:hydrogenase expression/formation protein HypE [Bdellovibrionales bacterium]MCB9084009.1 hydrogenase expression/formation protein HypE [Pseudobdellovibrionaceae bacterium]